MQPCQHSRGHPFSVVDVHTSLSERRICTACLQPVFSLRDRSRPELQLANFTTDRLPSNSSSVLQCSVDNSSKMFSIPPISWSDITACTDDTGYKLLATSLVSHIDDDLNRTYDEIGNKNLYNSTNVWSSNTVRANATGFLCTPHFWTIPVSVSIDAIGLVSTNFDMLTNATKENPIVGIGFDFLQAQLNDIYATGSIKIFEAAATNNQTSQHANSYDWSQYSGLEVMQRCSYLYLWYNDQGHDSSYSIRDSFRDTIGRSSVSKSISSIMLHCFSRN